MQVVHWSDFADAPCAAEVDLSEAPTCADESHNDEEGEGFRGDSRIKETKGDKQISLTSTLERKANCERLEALVNWVRKGKLVALPTETVYGLTGNGLDASVVRKIFAFKKRPLSDPLILLLPYSPRSSDDDIAAILSLYDVVPVIKALLERLIRAFWPGPLSLVAKANADLVPSVVTAGTNYVAIRSPDVASSQMLLRSLPGTPLAAPSANPSGRVSPTKAAHVISYFADHPEADETLMIFEDDAHACKVGLESTILKVRTERGEEGGEADEVKLEILRPGAIGAEAIEKATNLPVLDPRGRPLELMLARAAVTTSPPLATAIVTSGGERSGGGGGEVDVMRKTLGSSPAHFPGTFGDVPAILYLVSSAHTGSPNDVVARLQRQLKATDPGQDQGVNDGGNFRGGPVKVGVIHICTAQDPSAEAYLEALNRRGIDGSTSGTNCAAVGVLFWEQLDIERSAELFFTRLHDFETRQALSEEDKKIDRLIFLVAEDLVGSHAPTHTPTDTSPHTPTHTPIHRPKQTPTNKYVAVFDRLIKAAGSSITYLD